MRVAIAGAGVIGAAIAYELAQVPGLELSVFEAQAQPATGATGAALGVMMGIISRKTKGRAWRLRQQAVNRYDTLIAELEAQTQRTIPYNRQGIVALRFRENDDLDRWQALQRQRRAQGYALEIWDRDQLQARCPQINAPQIDDPQINDPQVCGAVYAPGDRQVDPVALTQALVQAAQAQGVTFNYNQAIIRDAQGNITRGDRLPLAADVLILTAGLGTPPLAPTVDLRPVLGQALQLKLPQSLGIHDFQPVITGQDVLFVPLGNGRYWLGATVEFPDEAGVVVAQAQARAEFWQAAVQICPAIATAMIEREWSGLRPRPWGQGAPVITELEGSDRPTLVAAGHYRNGVLLALGTAQAAKEWLLTLVSS
ncbi:MAG: NAD(P)/FAD-dependent oxidoreductase [Spirulinaceae cyanobacterium]